MSKIPKKNKEGLTINNDQILNGGNSIDITVILENGDSLIDLMKKAQQQSAELNNTLKRIEGFIPQFRIK